MGDGYDIFASVRNGVSIHDTPCVSLDESCTRTRIYIELTVLVVAAKAPYYPWIGTDKNIFLCVKDAVQSDLRMCTKEPSFYYTNSLFRFLFHFMF